MMLKVEKDQVGGPEVELVERFRGRWRLSAHQIRRAGGAEPWARYSRIDHRQPEHVSYGGGTDNLGRGFGNRQMQETAQSNKSK